MPLKKLGPLKKGRILTNDLATEPLSNDIEQVSSHLQEALGFSPDLNVHRFKSHSGKLSGIILFLKTFTDLEKLTKSVIEPLLNLEDPPQDVKGLALVLPLTGTVEANSLQPLTKALAWGESVLLVSGLSGALTIPLKQVKERVVTEPEGEKIVRGPRDGFVESIWSNIGLLRQRIKNPDLRLEIITLGKRTFVEVGIVYVGGLANPKIVEEVRRRIKRIDVDRLLAVGYINEFITDSPWSPFPTVQITERPDHLTLGLMDGRVGILLDGTPIVLVAPMVFWDFLKAPDDYVESPYFVTFIRLIRILGHLVTLLLPGLYIALTTFHLQMLPESLAIIISGARTKAPLPISVEILLMEFTVEVLREAGLRLPGVFGQTIGIVGALVIGEAAVTAGLVGPFTVVLVALTTLASFMVPGYNAAVTVRMLRFPLIFLSAALGFFGLTLGGMFYLVHLVSLRSFGVPYFAPLAPLFLQDMRNMLVRLPLHIQLRRPTYYRALDKTKQGPEQEPGPEKGGNKP